MKRTILITNGKVVLPDRIIPAGEVYSENGLITYVGRQTEHRGRTAELVIDAREGYIIPGFIDIHSDAIEKELEPRPGAFMSTELAFCELEKKLAGQGITTMYHSYSFAGAECGVREDKTASDSIRSIVATADKHALINNKIHLRFEITNYPAVALIENLIGDGCVDLLSFMDHTPGQGQYPTVQDYRRYVEKTYHLPFQELEKILARKDEYRIHAGESVERLRLAAQAAGIRLASHDDDSAAQVNYYRGKGATISEFPVNLEAAKAAFASGNYVCVGAPNIIRGKSTGKGMRAIDAIDAGVVNMICSDYYPPSILHAVFSLAGARLNLPEAVAMAALNPAKALGLDRFGSLEEGKQADVIVVAMREQIPVVLSTIVNGCLVYGIKYRSAEYYAAMSQEQPA